MKGIIGRGFRGVIVLLFLVLCCNIIFAEKEWRYSVDNEAACDCSIAGAYLMNGGAPTGLSASCAYYHEQENTVKGTRILYLYSSFTFWDKIESTKTALQLHKEQQYEPYLKTLKNSDKNIIVQSIETKDSFSLISRYYKVGNEYGNNNKKQFEYEVNRQVRYDDYALITIKGSWRTNGEDPQDASVVSTIDSMESCMKKVIDNSLNDGTSKFKTKLLVENMPMKHIVVYNKDDSNNEDKWTTTNENGEFSLSVKDPKNFDFVVDMIYHKDSHDYFKLIGDDRQEAFKLLFHIEDGEIVSITIDNGDFKLPIHDINLNAKSDIHLDKYLTVEEGLISPLINYIHFTEVLEYYKDVLKVDLTSRTLDVLLHKGDSASYSYENDRSWILMSNDYSEYENEYRPFVAYHEFSHYVQHMLYGEVFEDSLSLFNINHGGYANPTTSDSFIEGFAAFMPVIIANHYDRYWAKNAMEKRVSLYPLSGSLDDNWKAWDRQGKVEEFAVAGILWDLVDGKDEADAEFKSMEVELRNVLKEIIDENDMDKDGIWSRQELFYSFVMQNANLNLDDYLDASELDMFNDSQLMDYMDKNNKKDSMGRILVEDFWDYMILNWEEVEKDWKEEMPEMYAEIPDKITLDDLMKKLSSVSDDDGIDLTFEQVWDVLKKPHADFSTVYESVVKIGDKDLIDDVFIEHGFFMETAIGNGEYDVGEPYQDLNKNGKWDKSSELYVDLGEMKYDSDEKIGIASNYDRKLRKSFEPLDAEFVKVNPEVPFYELKYIIYGFDYYGLKLPSNIYMIRASNEDGMIYVPMPQNARVEIVPAGVVTKNPLVVSTAEFIENYEVAIDKGYFTEHEFDYEGEVPVYYSAFNDVSSGGGFSLGFWLVLIVIVLFVFFVFKKKSKNITNRKKKRNTKKKIE